MASKRFRHAVGIDPERILSAAVDAALGETEPPRKRHHPGRVLATGAALAAAAAVGQRRVPRLAKMPLRMGLHKLGDMAHVDELADALRERLVPNDEEPDDGHFDDDEELAGDGFDDDEEELIGDDLDDEEFDDEPRDESDDSPEDDDFDDEDDEGFDDEPEDDDGPRDSGDEVEDEEELEDDEDLEAEPNAEASEEEPEAVEDDDEDPGSEEDDEGVEDGDEEIAARGLELGASSESNGRRTRDRAPDLVGSLRTRGRRAPVMRRDSVSVDPATRPPEPDRRRAGAGRRSSSNNPKSTAARA